MFRFLIRLAGLFALAGAVVGLVVDGTKSVAASALVLTPLGEAWRAASPASLAAAEAGIAGHLGSIAWDPLATSILALPAWFVFGALGALLLFITRPPRFRVAA